MSTTPEASVPTTQPPAVAASEEIIVAQRPTGRRPVLRAGILLGGALAWSTAVFGAMVEHELWMGASAGFALALVLVAIFVLSVRSSYPGPIPRAGRLAGRAAAVLALGALLWAIDVFITLILCERSASAAMLVLGVLGMLTVFIVLALFSRERRASVRDPAIRSVRALAWLTVILVSVTALVPPLAEAMARRGRRSHDLSATTGVADVAED